jgi:hypothetical protein
MDVRNHQNVQQSRAFSLSFTRFRNSNVLLRNMTTYFNKMIQLPATRIRGRELLISLLPIRKCRARVGAAFLSKTSFVPVHFPQSCVRSPSQSARELLKGERLVQSFSSFQRSHCCVSFLQTTSPYLYKCRKLLWLSCRPLLWSPRLRTEAIQQYSLTPIRPLLVSKSLSVLF